MKISSFRCFGALNSGPVFDAVESSLKKLGHEIVYNEFDADMYIIWSLLWSGRMLSNKEIYAMAKQHNIRLMILEVGMIRRNVTWKVGIDNFKLPTKYIPRSHSLRVSLKPWQKNGNHVLICGQNPQSQLWHNQELMPTWVQSSIQNIQKYTDRPIMFRPHPRDRTIYAGLPVVPPQHIAGTYDSFNFEEAIRDAWIIISPSSNPGPQSVINGKPVITHQNSMAYSMSTMLQNIECPNYPDRTEWFEQICNTEWTIQELNDPKTLDMILSS
jgi:hypothetical protein